MARFFKITMIEKNSIFKYFLLLIAFYIFMNIFVMATFIPIEGYIDYVWYNTCLTGGGGSVSKGTSEPGFGLVCSFTSKFSNDIAVIIPRYMSLALLIISFLYILKKVDIYTGLFHLYMNGFQTLGAYRQGSATIFLCVAIIFLWHNKKFKAYIFSVLGILFHYTSLYFLLVLFFRNVFKRVIGIFCVSIILFIEVILTSPFLAMFLPSLVLHRYNNLFNESLPGSGYFALGKVWYVVYYSYFNVIAWKSMKNIRGSFIEKTYNVFLPMLFAVPILTLMDSWSATRISTLTNPFELLFFGVIASPMQRLIIFMFYLVRTSIAFVNFFVV